LEADLQGLVAAANAARAEATDAESKQEGRYDMRGQLAAYLAAGQAKLAAELAEAIAAYRVLRPIKLPPEAAAAIGALVTLESQNRRTHYFIGPARGGTDIDLAGETVTLVTAASPLGRQLLGCRAGNLVTLPGPKSGQTQTVLRIE
jgi:transcription elongation GreA/GreB family factor